MYLKRRYNKVFTIFVIFQLIIIIFLLYFPMNLQFKEFSNFYLNMQGEIFERILEKKKNDLLQKVIETAIWDDLYRQIQLKDKEWFETNLISDIQQNYDIDSIILLNENKEVVFLNVKRLPYLPEFRIDDLVTQALNNIKYNVGLIKYGDKIFLIGLSPVVKSTSRFDPNGVLIFVQIFDHYFITQKITAFMDQELIPKLIVNTTPSVSDLEKSIPLNSIDGQLIGHVILKYNNQFLKQIKELFLRNISINIILLFTLFIFLSNLMSKKFARRIEILHSEVETAIKCNFNYKISMDGNDEISDLADYFNTMSQTMQKHIKQILKTNEKLHKIFIDIIRGLITAIEVKDPYTKGHSYRVMLYSELIAKKMNYPDIQIIRMAALLHDIGKIGVPENILNKPDKLTPEEFEIIKAHPNYGYKILSNIEEFNRVKDIIRFHHERIDGKGYPVGIKDTAIPLESRIIAVADTFDAITSDRAYRKGMTVEKALEELQNVKGQQLDEKIVDIFVEVARENNYFKELLNNETTSIEEIDIQYTSLNSV
ncbi:hypothetical protein BBF96_01420 [Anoxybacter fermentans]|uniref:HD-GYP domain-containing protein n=1 Tax=Anoxybacter fermentans TaxID=1323375 RepID=A0A3Q9HNN1_9FIRM|nr:HD domain-containing phosphohydrolase [Anoxybacter fermentans]AZR72170.1 hypothetical protein BBF96_01420 [Anoxybacter fermentans]